MVDSLDQVLRKKGVERSEPRNRSGRGGYPEDVIGKKIVDMPSELRESTSMWTKVWITDKCIIKSHARWHYGEVECAHYHEEIFEWNCDEKYKNIVLSLWKKPDYNGYLSEKGKKLRLNMIRQSRNSKL